MEKLVSIIVPVYNMMMYLQKCVDSLIEQSYQNIEIILVNDGSTDNSGSLCDHLAKKDARIRVIHKSNGGLSDARNAGIDVATGDYLTFIDADDYYAPNAIEKLVEAATESNADIVCMGSFLVSSDYLMVKEERLIEETVSSDDYFRCVCEGTRSSSVCTKLFKPSVFQSARFTKGRLSEDFLFLLTVLFEPRVIRTIPFAGYYYYRRESSITHSGNKSSLHDAIQNCIELMQEASERNPSLVPYIARTGLHQASVMIRIIPEPVITKENVHLKRVVECLKLCSPYITEVKLPLHEKIIVRCALVSPVLSARFFRKTASCILYIKNLVSARLKRWQWS